MKKQLEKFNQFEISNPKYIFGGDDSLDKSKKKVRGNGEEEVEGGN